MKLSVDQDVQAVIEYMQSNIPAAKLIGVAEKLPELARLLWSDYSQDSFRAIELRNELMEELHEPQSIAI